MSQSAVVRDYRALEAGRRRANRLVLTVAGWEACRGPTHFAVWRGCCLCSFEKLPEGRHPGRHVRRRVRARGHRSGRGAGLCAPTPAAIPIAPLHI